MSTADIATTDVVDGPVWTLGERMWKARKARGWEQADVATAVGVSRPLVSKWERDISVPDAVQIRKFVESIDLPWVTFVWLTASLCFWPVPEIPGQMELSLDLDERPLLVAL